VYSSPSTENVDHVFKKPKYTFRFNEPSNISMLYLQIVLPEPSRTSFSLSITCIKIAKAIKLSNISTAQRYRKTIHRMSRVMNFNSMLMMDLMILERNTIKGQSPIISRRDNHVLQNIKLASRSMDLSENKKPGFARRIIDVLKRKKMAEFNHEKKMQLYCNWNLIQKSLQLYNELKQRHEQYQAIWIKIYATLKILDLIDGMLQKKKKEISYWKRTIKRITSKKELVESYEVLQL